MPMQQPCRAASAAARRAVGARAVPGARPLFLLAVLAAAAAATLAASNPSARARARACLRARAGGRAGGGARLPGRPAGRARALARSHRISLAAAHAARARCIMRSRAHPLNWLPAFVPFPHTPAREGTWPATEHPPHQQPCIYPTAGPAHARRHRARAALHERMDVGLLAPACHVCTH